MICLSLLVRCNIVIIPKSGDTKMDGGTHWSNIKMLVQLDGKVAAAAVVLIAKVMLGTI